MTTPPPTAARRVVLHIGAPKSGTTYLQRLLWQNREELAAAGLHLPGDHQREMFDAAIEVREVAERWGRDATALEGTWSRLCDQARSNPGTTLMSHELLAAATTEQARKALSHLEGLDVHVVYTAREISRQLVSEWQENIKNGSGQSFAAFRRKVMAAETPDEHLFWRYQNVLEALGRWGVDLPPDHLHVVVSPVGGSDPTELWRRFSLACGLGPEIVADPLVSDAANQTLGMTQVHLLRRVVSALDGRIEQPEYARIVKRLFAQRVLAGQSSPRPTCPPELVEHLTALSQEWIAGVEERGYRVYGDLAELLPTPPETGGRAPDDVPPDEEVAVAADAIAELLIEIARRPPPRKGPEQGGAPAGGTAEGVPSGPGSATRRPVSPPPPPRRGGRARAGLARLLRRSPRDPAR